MRSSASLPGNPWPHDMVITVEDDSQALLELLWVREAWQLRPEGNDLPPSLVDSPSFVGGSQRSAAPIVAWQDAWPGIWAKLCSTQARRVTQMTSIVCAVPRSVRMNVRDSCTNSSVRRGGTASAPRR